MAWLALIPPLLALVYAAWQGVNYRYWLRAKRPILTTTAPAYPLIAVVVPFRNEAAHLPRLLHTLRAQDYPPDRYFVILVDDHSSDGGGAGASETLLKLADARLPDTTVAYKKAALELGVRHAETAEIIVTTDADCHWPVGTLKGVVEKFREGADVVLGPVVIDPVTDYCTAFQALDLAGYQLFTAASVAMGRPTLANGAHFAFRREAFVRVDGYAGVDHLPSGDDVLLLHKFMAAGLCIAALTDPRAVVTTRPVAGWRATWKQRLRWAGKAGEYASPLLTAVQGLAFLTSLGIVVGLLLVPFGWVFMWGAGVAWLIKGVADWILLRSVCTHYDRKDWLRWYLPVQVMYPFYLVGIGTAALLGMKAEWKGRAG